MYSMNFYVTITTDGSYHVQNAVMGMMGQHHIHTKKGFEKWSKDVDKTNIIKSKGICDCGLEPGQVRSHTGEITLNERFDK